MGHRRMYLHTKVDNEGARALFERGYAEPAEAKARRADADRAEGGGRGRRRAGAGGGARPAAKELRAKDYA